MYSRNITYTDYNGDERTERFYFNMNKKELLDLELKYQEKGGIRRAMEKMMDDNDAKGVIGVIDELVCASYGEKASDGKRFIKGDEVLRDFTSTEAYSNLVMELLNDSEKLSTFMTAIMPADVRAEAEKALREQKEQNGEGVAVEASVK